MCEKLRHELLFHSQMGSYSECHHFVWHRCWYRIFQMDHLVGVRACVMNGLGWSVVPRILVKSALQNNEIIEIPELKAKIENSICIWWLRDRHDLKKISTVIEKKLFLKISS
mgnify:CR=1 FL=1